MRFGRIARVFDDVIPATRETDPMEVQESEPFKDAVREVGESFRAIDTAAEAATRDEATGKKKG